LRKHDNRINNYLQMIETLCNEILKSGSNIITKMDFEKEYITVKYRTI